MHPQCLEKAKVRCGDKCEVVLATGTQRRIQYSKRTMQYGKARSEQGSQSDTTQGGEAKVMVQMKQTQGTDRIQKSKTQSTKKGT